MKFECTFWNPESQLDIGETEFIEAENITELPARVYTRGFVYQYAKCLKMDPEEVAASYMNRVDQRQQKN